ncbi:12896_t:CDS:1, partial [Gigaspora margarita]
TVQHFYDSKNSVVFQKILGEKQNKPMLLSFLNSLLRCEGNNLIEE